MDDNFPDLTEEPFSFAFAAAPLPQMTERLEVIAQPQYPSKLRYRSDYTNNPNRRGVLHGTNNSNYQSPTIRIPRTYLDVAGCYIIRVCLVTVELGENKRRYIHPYNLEDVYNNQINGQSDDAVWYAIQAEDVGGIKSFPHLRVVKKKVDDLKNYGNLRVFDSSNDESVAPSSSGKEIIRAFNLDNAQLAFTVGQQILVDNNITTVFFSSTTVFSNIMSEYSDETIDPANDPTESSSVEPRTTNSLECSVYKYAPQSGQWDSNEPVLIFFTTKLKPKKYGDLKVTFECQRPEGSWSEPVLNLEVRDQMVSFRTPKFQYPIDHTMPVNIVLRQRRRTFDPLQFNYLPPGQCRNCQRAAVERANPSNATNANKRRRDDLFFDDTTTDSRRSPGEDDFLI